MLDTDSIQRHLELFQTIKLGSISALLGIIPQNLRAFGVGYDSTPVFVAIFDTPPTEEEKEDISCAITEVISHIDQAVEEKYLTIAYPEELAPHRPNWGWLYLRKEKAFQINFDNSELQLISKLCFEVLHRFRVERNEEKILKHFDFGAGTEDKVLNLLNEHPDCQPSFFIEELLFIRNAAILALIKLNQSNSYEQLGFELDDCLALLSRMNQEFLKS